MNNMDKSSMEKYIRELMEMSKKSSLPAEEKRTQSSQTIEQPKATASEANKAVASKPQIQEPVSPVVSKADIMEKTASLSDNSCEIDMDNNQEPEKSQGKPDSFYEAIPVFERRKDSNTLSLEEMDPVTDQALYDEKRPEQLLQQPIQPPVKREAPLSAEKEDKTPQQNNQDTLSIEEMDPVTDQSLYQESDSCPYPKEHDEKEIYEAIDEYLEQQEKKMKQASSLTGSEYEKATTDIFLSAINWNKEQEASPVFESISQQANPQYIDTNTEPQQQDIEIKPIPNPAQPSPAPSPIPNPPQPAPSPVPIPNPDYSNPAELSPEQEGTEPLYPLTPENEQSEFAPQTQAPLTDTGYIYFFVTSANQTFPIPDAVVTVSRREKGQEIFHQTVTTNASGITPKIALPAPDRKLTEAPSNVIPYETYTAKISKDGYYDITNIGLQIYGDQSAYAPVTMIPLPAGDNEKTNLEYIIPKNPLTNS